MLIKLYPELQANGRGSHDQLKVPKKEVSKIGLNLQTKTGILSVFLETPVAQATGNSTVQLKQDSLIVILPT